MSPGSSVFGPEVYAEILNFIVLPRAFGATISMRAGRIADSVGGSAPLREVLHDLLGELGADAGDAGDLLDAGPFEPGDTAESLQE